MIFISATLGPNLPVELYGPEMIHYNGDIYVIGGQAMHGSQPQANAGVKAIHKFSCSQGKCQWTTLTQKLKVGRYHTVAILMK